MLCHDALSLKSTSRWYYRGRNRIINTHLRSVSKQLKCQNNGAFHCMVRLGSARLVTARHGLVSPRSSAINERNVCTSSTDNETDIFWCVCSNKSCVRSFAGCADLNLAGICWVSCRKFSAAVKTILSGQSVISRVYTSRFGNGTDRLEPRPRWY